MIYTEVSATAKVNVLEVLVHVCDYLRTDAFTKEESTEGIDSTEKIIKLLKSKSGNQNITGTMRI